MPVLIGVFPRALALVLPATDAVLGRSWFAQHDLSDSELSNQHVKLSHVAGRYQIADAGSRNGTWLNGTRLTEEPAPFEDGAILRIGRAVFLYREQFSGTLKPAAPNDGLVGAYGLQGLAQAVAAVAKHQVQNVLIEGETGVGKELVAHQVARALRPGKPFAAVNVAGIAAGVFESQLFGHVAGAFSDARTASSGIIVAHQGGTIFLDEIGELSPETQAKLLRVLENREVLPVGASRALSVDVTIVAATNRDVEEMVEQGKFRRDLFARFAKARIHVPALRDRAEDLFGLAASLSERDHCTLPVERVEVEAVERLLLHEWPNNVRELDAALAAIRRVDPEPGLRHWAVEQVLGKAPVNRSALTRSTIEAALAASDGNLSAAAQRLGVSRGKLLRFRKRTIE
ncbi:MAG TPA: sigma 54-interacting transcriptional regulator [Polyangiaceae bacterium]|nr:sigma 54-interacting transcriptional regulator [Polyangiaceae bacterium]